MIVLDTHAWMWWAGEPERLSPAARRALVETLGKSPVFISAISCWEVAMLSAKGRVNLGLPIRDWITRALQGAGLSLAPLDPETAILSTSLPGAPPSDPSDQIILATALKHGAALVTKDEELRRYGKVRTIW